MPNIPLNHPITSDASDAASRLGAALASRQVERVVFAESCTAGLAAALLGQVSGISSWFCGSAVTYRESTKTEWLGVARRTLQMQTAESLATTSEMALGVLRTTPEATFSAAITGHLGPGAPPEIDGRVFLAIASQTETVRKIIASDTRQLVCQGRVERQYESAKWLMDLLHTQLS